jgi:hypothetical protein
MASYRWVSEVEPVSREMKLIQRPRCVVELRVEVRWFEEERGVPVERVLVRDEVDRVVVGRLIAEGEMDLAVEVWPDVREDHVVLVGEMRDA